ncbi:DnaJ sub C member 27 [Thoreauomyces humboldtii]|nr:DnaJ sub C member 27 [Thoreauomyces humboldtii]
MNTSLTRDCHCKKSINILSLGDSAMGKSCLIKRYCEGRYVQEYVSTIGIDYGVKGCVVNDEEVKVNFWDIGGSPHYRTIRTEFYKDTHGCMLVLDASATVMEARECVERWTEELKEFVGDAGPVLVIVGNKVDLRLEGEDGERMKEAVGSSEGVRYFETSAMTGQGVQEMFTQLFQDVIGKQLSQEPPNTSQT